MKKTILLAALALGATTFTTASAQSKDPTVLKVVTIEGNFSTFDPAYCYDTACSNILYNVLEGLFTYEGDSTKIIPALAAEIPSVQNGGISKDGKTYTVNLRKGIKFTDGTPVTAEDVKYSILRTLIISSDQGAAGLLLEPFTGNADLLAADTKLTFEDFDKMITVKDADTVVFKLAKPFGPFMPTMVGFGYVFSKSAALKAGEWDGTGKDWKAQINKDIATSKYTKTQPVGTGPFMIERNDEAQGTLILKRNDGYWRGAAKLSRVIIEGIKDDNTRIQKIKTGDADIGLVGAYPPALIASIDSIPGVIVVKKPALTLAGIFMNEKIDGKSTNYLGSGKLDGNGIPDNFFSDKNVRKAIAASIEYDAVIKDLMQNNGRQQSNVLISGLPGYNENAAKYKFDKAAATKFFKAAWGGKVWEQGFKFPVFWNTGNSLRQKVLEMIKKNVESLNPKFKVEVRELPFKQILKEAGGNQMVMWSGGWSADFADPYNFAQPFLASDGNYPRNMNYKNETLDKLIAQAVSESNPTKRELLYAKVAKMGFDEVPFVATTQGLNISVYRDGIQGQIYNPILLDQFYTISKK
jgi:peptide/nickel transport system substrate-binding protein